MDAIVQLIRNALCCVKDWHLFPDSFIHDPNVTAQYYVFPEPINKTTPLEIVICITQFYAFCSVGKSGFDLICSSLGKFNRIQRLMDVRTEIATAKKGLLTPAEQLVNQSLVQQGELAIRSLFIGANVMPIGIAFFWLTCNSLHITETGWIGGIWGLIHALTVMEICLVPLLYYMLVDGFQQLSKSKQMMEFATKLEKESTPRNLLVAANDKSVSLSKSSVPLSTFQTLTDWSPFYEEGFGLFGKKHQANPKKETLELEDEVAKVQRLLEDYGSSGKDDETDDDDQKEKQAKLLVQTRDETIERLKDKAHSAKMEGYREFLYFVFNFVAFYGYMLGVLVFYFDKEEDQGYYVQNLKFGLSNADADWQGNFAGDLMWTIEPVVILGSPMLFTWMKSSPSTATKKKDKKD